MLACLGAYWLKRVSKDAAHLLHFVCWIIISAFFDLVCERMATGQACNNKNARYFAHLSLCGWRGVAKMWECGLLQWRATKDFRDVTFLGPRIVDKLVLALIIMTLYWRVGENHKLSNYNNLAAVLFLWTILPGYAAAAFIPTIVLERPLFVRCISQCHP